MLMELVIRGITIGLVYALMGVGLALLNGVMRIINFAHGEFYMIGGYMAYYSMTLLGLPFYFAVPSAIAIITAEVRKGDWGKALGVHQCGPRDRILFRI